MDNKISTCIFDLDGVIVDTAKYHFVAWQELAKELGFEFTKKDNERLKGVSRIRSLEILLEIGNKELSDIEKQKLTKNKNKRYLELIQNLKPKDILPGVTKFIEQLKIRKIKIALGSASKNAMTILSNLEFTEPFEAIIDGTKVSKAKPNPEIFLEGAKAVGAKPEECIVFEDAQAGIDAAKNAGMFVIGIGNEENLKGANFIIEGFLNYTFDELLQKL